MNNQKFLNISKDPQISQKLVLALIILIILAIGGTLIYRYWWIPRVISSIKPPEVKERKLPEVITPEIPPGLEEAPPEELLELEIGE